MSWAWDGAAVGWYAPPATLTELRFHSPGLRAQPATLGNAPTNIATLYELRLAEGVTCSRIIARNGLVEIIRLSITPAVIRNTPHAAIPC